jgi:hypothetical protein
VHFLAAIAAGFEAAAGFEQLDVGGVLGFLGRGGLLVLFVGALFDWLLSRLLGGSVCSRKAV